MSDRHDIVPHEERQSLMVDHTATGPAGFYGGGEPASMGMDFRGYLTVLYRYKWLILLVTLLSSAAGYYLARNKQPIYAAEAVLWIEADGVRDNRGPIRQAELLRSRAWADLLRSFAVLDSVVVSERLYVRADLNRTSLFAEMHVIGDIRPGAYRLDVDEGMRYVTLVGRAGDFRERSGIGEPVGAAVGVHWIPDPDRLRPGDRIDFTLSIPRDAARALAVELRTRMHPDGQFLRVELSGPDPDRIASVLNALVDRYVDVVAELKSAKMMELTAILDEQLQYAQSNLTDAELELERFRVETIALPSEPATPVNPGLEATRDPVFERFFDMNIERDRVRRDLEALEDATAVMRERAAAPIQLLESIEAVQRSAELGSALTEVRELRAELRALRLELTDEHREVQRVITTLGRLESQTVPAMLADLAEALRTREGDLERRIRSAGGELQRIPPRAIEEARLRRSVNIAENMYSMLRQRYEEARLAAVTSIPDLRLLDRATAPLQPVRDDRIRLVLLFLGGGLAAGMVGALLLDRLDSRLRVAAHVPRDLGLPVLGTIPHLRQNGKAARPDELIEAFRGLRFHLLGHHMTGGPFVATISSSEPGEGKTFVTANLGIAFAQQGHTTLVIDGDTRKPDLHRVLDATPKPGLTEYLAGEIPIDSVIQATSHLRLDFIAAGKRRTASPELLGSAALPDLLAELSKRYSVILVDSPPLGAGVDSFILAKSTGRFVMVVRLGQPDRDALQARLDFVRRLPVRILGAVLNDIVAGKRHGYYGYYGYMPGYGADHADADAADDSPARLQVPTAEVEAGRHRDGG